MAFALYPAHRPFCLARAPMNQNASQHRFQRDQKVAENNSKTAPEPAYIITPRIAPKTCPRFLPKRSSREPGGAHRGAKALQRGPEGPPREPGRATGVNIVPRTPSGAPKRSPKVPITVLLRRDADRSIFHLPLPLPLPLPLELPTALTLAHADL